MNPCVSIIMPCFNASEHLDRSVGSVLAQTRLDWELIVVDDGSNDDTWNRLEQLAQQDVRVRPIRQANAGAAAARNRGLGSARGDYIAFLDSDDTWHPEFLASLMESLQQVPEASIAYCGWQNIGLGGGRDAPYVPPDYEAGDKTGSMLRACPWPIHAALVRADLVHQAKGFDESLSSCMDYDLWLRLATAHRVVRVPRVLAHYHHHGGIQITGNKTRIALNHLRAQQKFLAAHPSVARKLGTTRVRELTFGELLQRGYSAYWQRDLAVARLVFRRVMANGYGSAKDWLYMLPSWLPQAWHRRLIERRDRADRT